MPKRKSSTKTEVKAAAAEPAVRRVRRRSTKVEVKVVTVESTESKESKSRKLIGAHVSMAGGFSKVVPRALQIGANAFALDTKSKRQWSAKPIPEKEAAAFKAACAKHGFGPESILPHGSYLMNCGSPDPETLAKSRANLVEELKRCDTLGIKYYNFHPGSTVGKISPDECLKLIAESINLAHEETAGSSVVTVIENMAGQGNTVGGSFEHLATIIDNVRDKDRIGVCLDTCHMFAAGYDIRSRKEYDKTMAEFEKVVGFKYLRGVHLNDSKTALGSKRDLHENIGKGFIGEDTFRFVMQDSRFDGVAMILETPTKREEKKDAWETVYAEEIEALRAMEKK